MQDAVIRGVSSNSSGLFLQKNKLNFLFHINAKNNDTNSDESRKFFFNSNANTSLIKNVPTKKLLKPAERKSTVKPRHSLMQTRLQSLIPTNHFSFAA